MKRLALAFLLAGTFAACAKVYTAPGARVAAREHRIIAVMPPTVTIAPSRKVSAEAIAMQQVLESENFQREIAAWLMRRKQQGRMAVDVQETDETMALLDRAGYLDGKRMTPAEMSEALDVDAVITSTITMSKPMSTGAAIASAILLGFSNTNEVGASMVLYDGGERLWSYDHRVSGGLGSTPATVTNALMRNASKKLPYIIR